MTLLIISAGKFKLSAGSGHFITRVKGGREGVIYLAMQYAKWMEILEPVSVRGRNEGNFQRRAEPLREKIKSF